MIPGGVYVRADVDVPDLHIVVLSSLHHMRHGHGNALVMPFAAGATNLGDELGFLPVDKPEGVVVLTHVYTLPLSALADHVGTLGTATLAHARRVVTAMMVD